MIKLDNVCVDFPAGRGGSGATRAVEAVSLRIAAGEIFGIVGTSGAGKVPCCARLMLCNAQVKGESILTASPFLI